VKAVLPAATRNSKELAINDALQWNDTLHTDAKGRLRAGLTDGSILSLGSNSQLQVVQHDAKSQQTLVDLNYGKLRSQVTKITQPNGTYQVKTSNAVIGVIGTDFYVRYHEGRTAVVCYQGIVSVTPLGGAKIISSNNGQTGVKGPIKLTAGQVAIVAFAGDDDDSQLVPLLIASIPETDVPDTPVAAETEAANTNGPGVRLPVANEGGPPPISAPDRGGAASPPLAGGSGTTSPPVAGGAGTTSPPVAGGTDAAPQYNSATPHDSTSAPPELAANERPGDETKLIGLINNTRAERGLPPLAIDPLITEAARRHTQLMVQYSGLSHQFPGEPPLEDRIDNLLPSTEGVAENVSWSIDVISAHHDLVNDPPHLRNILDPTYNAIGVGIIRSGKHIYVTEDFARVIYEPSKGH
jgi:uncharacterized protein YkwD